MENADNLPLTKKEKRELRKIAKEEIRKKAARSQRIHKIVIWTLGILFLVAFFFLVKKSASVSPSLPNGTITTVTSTDHVKGKESAKHLLIEYSDFQCPACAQYQALLNKLLTEHPDNIRLVYRYFPLREIHKNADRSAMAAEAAGIQGKFWEMHDVLFTKQTEWAESSNAKEKFVDYAKSLSLNIDQFNKDIDSQQIKDTIDNAYLAAIQANFNHTPTFILDGREITPQSYDELVQLTK